MFNFFLNLVLKVDIEPKEQILEKGTSVFLKATVTKSRPLSELSYEWYRYNDNTELEEALIGIFFLRFCWFVFIFD